VIDVRRLGRIGYAEGLELQKTLVEDRRAGRIGDTLLLLEHPPVITLGVKTRGRQTNIIASPAELARRGVEVFETGRGGDVTYHGPGQLVGYPIFDLRPDRCDVHRYVRDLEEVMIRVCSDYGIEAERVKGFSGAWIPSTRDGSAAAARSGQATPEKIGAIGVRISRWITSHGFAFNVTTNIDFFNLIVPCGIADKGVTSLAAKVGRAPDMREVEDRFVRHLAAVFERQPQESPEVTTAVESTT